MATHRRYCIIILLLAGISTNAQLLVRGVVSSSRRAGLTRNVDTVAASAYSGIATSSVDFGGVQNIYVINYANASRIAQTGTVTQIEFYMAATRTNLSTFSFEVWRRNGSNYDRVATQNVFSSLTAGAGTKTINLSPTIDVQEGDLTGFSWTGSSTVANLLTSVSGQSPGSYYTTSSPATTNYNWTGQTLGSSYIPIRVKMQAPHIMFIGDSYPSGYPSYYPTSDPTDYANNMTFTFPYKVAASLSFKGQNMGYQGDNSLDVANRYATDVVAKKPKIAVINVGGNDVQGGRSGVTQTQAQMITNLTSIFDAGNAAGIKQFYVSISAFTAGVTGTMQSIDSRNTAIQTLCAGKGVTFIDIRSTIGQFRSGGDSGNLWDIKPAYDSGDGVHLNDAGYTQVANLIVTAINAYISTL